MYGGEGVERWEKQGGQQEDDGWVMVQRMHGRDVADDNEVGCTGTEQVAMSTGESLDVPE
jgi:hypothetical protein